MKTPMITFCLSLIPAMNSVAAVDDTKAAKHEGIGFGTGALIGGFIGGPDGAVIGAGRMPL